MQAFGDIGKLLEVVDSDSGLVSVFEGAGKKVDWPRISKTLRQVYKCVISFPSILTIGLSLSVSASIYLTWQILVIFLPVGNRRSY